MPEPPPPHRRRATALRYEHGDLAPRIAATGTGYVAERIIAAAREAGVPVREDRALVEALATLELGQAIPAELWRAVAEVLAWAYKLDGTAAARRRD
jgi:flagellar biosynthesis protein